MSGAKQLPHICVTPQSSTNRPQLSFNDLQVVVALHPQVPGPPAVLLHVLGALHVPQDT